MFLLLILTTVLFLFATFFGTLEVHITNPLVAYVFYELTFVLQHFSLFFIGFLIVFASFIMSSHKHKNHVVYKNYIHVLMQIFTAIGAGFLFGFVAVLVIAFVELNIFAVLMNINPVLLGVSTDTRSIIQQIQKNGRPPSIIPTDRNPQQEVVAIANATAGQNNFYGNTILAGFPSFLILPVRNYSSSFLFLDNTLIVARMDIADLQAISPLMGYLFVQSYFPDRVIHHFPKVTVMTEKEYQNFRKNDVKTKLGKIGSEAKTLSDEVSSFSAVIRQDKAKIADGQKAQSNLLQQQNKAYDACLSTGTYVSGVFRPTYTKGYCQNILEEWNTKIDQETSNIDQLNKQLALDQQKLATYTYYANFFKVQGKLLGISTENIPSELGVFEPPSAIKIIINSTSSHDIADYFETLSHEYLHYASFIQNKSFASPFFEEGLTEYFARQAIQDSLHIDTNIGYPVNVRIIKEMTKRIAEPDLADIYFNKDETALEKELNLAYGDNFYKDNYVTFESLQYTSDPKQALKLANTIMYHMGAKPLTSKDLYSSF